MTIIQRLHNYLGLVRFSHTIFALPFALMSALVAAQGIPSWNVILWIIVCMIGARTSAMTFNRIVDRRIDAQNPRTSDRHIPSGQVNLPEAIGLWFLSSAIFFFGTYQLNSLTLLLSPVALVIICGYSFCKRFTSLSHFVLGLALAIAPVGAWIAVTGAFAIAPLILACAVLLWVAGFDAIYALMDEEFDRDAGLHSLVVSLGKTGALRVSLITHILSVVMIGLFGVISGLGWLYWTGAFGFGALIIYEHALVSPTDIKRINIAFFNVNGIISIGLFIFTCLDIFLLH